MIKHNQCQSWEDELSKKDARIRALKTWLWCLAITFGAVMMLMGAAILTYLQDIVP